MVEPLFTAEIDWNVDGVPVSRRYGDVYFSSEGGLDEAQHVFVAGNQLPLRFADAEVFTIGETGFGSGLNFLAAWQEWEKHAPAHGRLRFFSAEKYPLNAQDMARIHAMFPQTAHYGQQLCEQLPLPVPGYHRLYFAGGRVQLTLMYGDALAAMEQQDAQADAWFLDGFAPRLNPELWDTQIAAQIRRLSAPDATFATFSTSPSSMDSLRQAGFSVQKQPGFGRKKYMLTGQLVGRKTPAPTPQTATVIGAGLAGAGVAYALALRNCAVTVQEKTEIAASASGNPSAIFYPGVTVGWQPLSQLYFMGFSHSLSVLKTLCASHVIDHDQCGMLLFPKPREDAARQAKVLATMQPDACVFSAVDTQQASAIAGTKMPQGALYFPAGGWVNLQQMTAALLAHPNIAVRTHDPATAIAPDPAAPTILCNACDAAQLYPPLAGSMHGVSGQITHLPSNDGLKSLRCVLSYGGYLTPAITGKHHLGATYDKQLETPAITAQGHEYNLHKLGHFLGQDIPATGVDGWAAMRSVTRNRLPLVGKLEDGLYASLAHASRGVLSCALSGEYIASQLYGDPLPLPRNIAQLLKADRFVLANSPPL